MSYKKIVCYGCSGAGRIECHYCSGAGITYDATVAPQEAHACPRCGGGGYRICKVCGGTGIADGTNMPQHWEAIPDDGKGDAIGNYSQRATKA